MPKRRKTKVTAKQLHENEKLYIEMEDAMIVHRTAVDAEASELPMPLWVIREWTKWSRQLIKTRGQQTSLTGAEIGRALDLLEPGSGRGTPLSRAKIRERDALLARVLDRMRDKRGISVAKATEEISDLFGWTEDALRGRYARHRKRIKP